MPKRSQEARSRDGVGFSVHAEHNSDLEADFSQVAKSCGESVHSEQNNNVSQPSGTFSSHYYSESEANRDIAAAFKIK